MKKIGSLLLAVASLQLLGTPDASAKKSKVDLNDEAVWSYHTSQFFSFGIPKDWQEVENSPLCPVGSWCVSSKDGKIVVAASERLFPLDQVILAYDDDSWDKFVKLDAPNDELVSNKLIKGTLREIKYNLTDAELAKNGYSAEKIARYNLNYESAVTCYYHKSVKKKERNKCQYFADHMTFRGPSRGTESVADLIPLSPSEAVALAKLYSGITVEEGEFPEKNLHVAYILYRKLYMAGILSQEEADELQKDLFDQVTDGLTIPGGDIVHLLVDYNTDPEWNYANQEIITVAYPKNWTLVNLALPKDLENIPEAYRADLSWFCLMNGYCAFSPNGHVILSSTSDLYFAGVVAPELYDEDAWAEQNTKKLKALPEDFLNPVITDNKAVRGAYRQMNFKFTEKPLEKYGYVSKEALAFYPHYSTSLLCHVSKDATAEEKQICDTFFSKIHLNGVYRMNAVKPDLMPLTVREIRALADIYAGRKVTPEAFGPQDPELAYKIAKRLDDIGLFFGMWKVGVSLVEGNGVAQDIEAGIEKLNSCASGENTFAPCHYSLYLIYSNDAVGKFNRELALEQLKKAAELGYNLSEIDQKILENN